MTTDWLGLVLHMLVIVTDVTVDLFSIPRRRLVDFSD